MKQTRYDNAKCPNCRGTTIDPRTGNVCETCKKQKERATKVPNRVERLLSGFSRQRPERERASERAGDTIKPLPLGRVLPVLSHNKDPQFNPIKLPPKGNGTGSKYPGGGIIAPRYRPYGK